jgi:3-hydroxybutyryl-CoA dehydrogenase
VNILSKNRKYPHNFIGLHFFNPAHLMKLVEIIRTPITKDEVLNTALEFCRSIKKVPVIAKDVPGFIVNRVARNYYNEAMRIATENASNPKQIDTLMKSLGFKMGPFELMDLIGNDVNLEVTKSVAAQYFNEPRFTPSLMQQDIVNAGRYGRKSGAGFYEYE